MTKALPKTVEAAIDDLEKIVADDQRGADDFNAGLQAVFRAARARQETEYRRELAAGVSTDRAVAIRIWLAFHEMEAAGHYDRIEPPHVLN